MPDKPALDSPLASTASRQMGMGETSQLRDRPNREVAVPGERQRRGGLFGHALDELCQGDPFHATSAGWFSLAGKIVELHGTIGFKGGLNGMQM